MKLCDYGCGSEAMFYFKTTKKWCCSSNVSKCKKVTQTISEKAKKRIRTKEHSIKIGISNKGKHREHMLGDNNPMKRKECKLKAKNRMINGGSEFARSFISNESIKNRVKKTRKTMEEKGFWTKESELENIQKYHKEVLRYTTISSKEKYTIDELKKNRKNGMHLDHIFSIHEGFILGILPQIIGSKSNITFINSSYNCSKGGKCNITLEELYKNYDKESAKV